MQSAGPLRLFALVLLLASTHAQMSPGLIQDREGLLALKAAVLFDPKNRLKTWRPEGNPCVPKPWAYVSCTLNRVSQVNMANLGLAATLPTKLRLLSELTILNLADNRLTGPIPQRWSDPTSFQKLRTLNLANNGLTGSLPVWSKRYSWRTLERIDLSNNYFDGGLPNSWLGPNKVLSKVRYLDLSNNFLGYTGITTGVDNIQGVIGDVQSTKRIDWCDEDAADIAAGWCPSDTPIAGTLDSLEMLDLSNNGFVGQLPPKWPFMMRRLQFLIINGNSLTKDGDVDGLPTEDPSPLPDIWASGSKRGFPSLKQLVLYPGNEYLCSIPNNEANNLGYRDVNLEAAYKVLDATSSLFDADNPAICPAGDTEEALPTTIDLSAVDNLKVTFAAAPASVYGFRVTIAKLDVELTNDAAEDVHVPLPEYNNRVFRYYKVTASADEVYAINDLSNNDGVAVDADGKVFDITLPTDTDATTEYKVQVNLIYMDGSESAVATEIIV